MDSPDLIKTKKTAINHIIKKDNKCFQYAVRVILNHADIGKHPKRITKIKVFADKHNSEGANYSSKKEGWKKIEKNNLRIDLNNLFFK